MKRECPQCGFELRGMNGYEKFVHEKLERFTARVPDQYDGDTLTGFDVWLESRPGTTLNVPDLGADVTLVEAQTHFSYEHAENAVYLVLNVGGSNCYIKHGSRDSYGGSYWDDGEFRAVTKQVREVWVWEENA